MLDLHVHVLPGIDDGPRTLEDALALAKALADDGIEHVVATPHIYPGVFDNTPSLIAEAFDLLQTAMVERDIPLTMSWAAEVRICPEIIEWLERRRLPLLNGGVVGPASVLIELPDGQIPVGTDRLMGLLIDRGITPLIAHPERNKAVMEQPARLEALRRMGCKFQLTAGSVLGEFGTRANTTARALLDAGWVDVLATDAHNRSSRRPRLSAARAWVAENYDAALAERLCVTEPTAISGVGSFTLENGADRLVFRDLPAASTPLDLDKDWSANLLLDSLGAMPTEGGPLKDRGTLEKDAWSLTDFKIDSVLDNLREVSLDGDLQSTPGNSSNRAGGSTYTSSAPAEDWALPPFKPVQAQRASPSPTARPRASSTGGSSAPASTPPAAPAPTPTPVSAQKAPATAAPVTDAPPPSVPVPTREPVAVAEAASHQPQLEVLARAAPDPVSSPTPTPTRRVWQSLTTSGQKVTARTLPPEDVVTLPLASAIPTLTRVEPIWAVEQAAEPVAKPVEPVPPPVSEAPAPAPTPIPAPIRQRETVETAVVQDAPLPEPVRELIQEPVSVVVARGMRLSEMTTLHRDALHVERVVEASRPLVKRPGPAAPTGKGDHAFGGAPQPHRAAMASVARRPVKEIETAVPSLPALASRPALPISGSDKNAQEGVRGFRLSDLPVLPPLNKG